MGVTLAAQYETGGRIVFSAAIPQATCEDATIMPFVRGHPNVTPGCYGCGEATDLG